jgi:hypothetical protein
MTARMDTLLPSLFIAVIDLPMQVNGRGGRGVEPFITKGRERGFLSVYRYSANTYTRGRRLRVLLIAGSHFSNTNTVSPRMRSQNRSRDHRLNTELDLQILFGLLCTAVLIS